MNRRGFLGAMLGVLAAPAIVRAESLMKIIVPSQEIILLDDEGIVIPKPTGWHYEPGQYNGHDLYMLDGGPRFDRAIIPSPLVNLLTDPSRNSSCIQRVPSFW